MIEIKQLNKKGLEEFIASPSFDALQFLPISKHRAQSHITNPRADENDTLLLLAYEGNTLVGYLGVLPDLIHYNGKSEKCGWLSCLWIDNAQRGKRIAQQLVNTAIETWKKRILVTEFTAPAKGLYDKTGIFNDLAINEGTRLYVRSDLQTILPPKKTLFEKIKPFLKITDSLFNLLLDSRFLFKSNKLNELELEQVNTIDDETATLIQSKQNNSLYNRGIDELNWIINNPWILSSPPTLESKKYHFSSVDNSFDFYPLKIKRNGNLVAFLLFSKRNNSLKLPYCYYNNIEDVLKVIEHVIIKWKISTFTVFNKTIANQLQQSSSIALYKKIVVRQYIISNVFDLNKHPREFEIQDGDADCSFT